MISSRTKIQLVASILVSVCFGCDRDELIYDLPHEPAKVVANFAGVNDVKWNGDVSLSRPILSHGLNERPPGTTVKLYEDGIFIESLLPTQGHFFDNGFESKQNFPKPDHTYTIEVTTQDYAMVTSSYVQPSLVHPTGFEYKKLGPLADSEIPPMDGGENVSLRVSFLDPPGDDYYEIVVKIAWDTSSYHQTAGSLYLDMIDPPYRKLEHRYSGTPGFILSDERFDGQEASFLFKSEYYFHRDFRTGEVEKTPKYYWVEVRHPSREYYEYAVTHLLQINTYGDPYAQPTKVFTNIEGGLGLFGGFTRTLTRYKVQE
jgi:hypothetical protein